MSRTARPRLLPALAAVAATLALAPAARAQSRTDAGTEGLTRTHQVRVPGTFQGPATTTGADVSGGAAATTASAPTTELRGAGGPAPDVITGPIGPSDAARLVRAQMPRLRVCYERVRATRPTLAGRIELRFTIGRDGQVTQATASGMPDTPEIASCVADALRQTTFPRPEGDSLQLVYPLMFVPEPTAAPARPRPRGRTPGAPARAR